MADRLTDHHHRHLTGANLRAAYRRLVDLFARYEVPVTFAFVTAFVMTEPVRRRNADRFRDVDYEGANWLRHYREAESVGNFDGWFCPEALEMVADHPEHEIACHGFCHLPLREGGISPKEAETELRNAREAARDMDLDPRTFVYPRNLVGHLGALARVGFEGYRLRAPGGESTLSRIGNLLSEFNVMTPAQLPSEMNGGALVPIPSGYYLNWRRGPRAWVPPWVTIRRWSHILASAAGNGRVAHLFLHPHNLIDGPGTYEALAAIVAEAAELRDRGQIEIITQATYCAEDRNRTQRDPCATAGMAGL